MLRNIFLVAPLLAFAVAQPSSARPLSVQTQESEWCWGDCEEEEENEGDMCEDVTVCVFAKVKLCRGENRSWGDSCRETCSELAADGCSANLGASASPANLAACTAELATRCELDCRPKDLALSIDPAFGGGHKPNKPNKPGGGQGGGGDSYPDGEPTYPDCGGQSQDGDDCVVAKVKACATAHRD